MRRPLLIWFLVVLSLLACNAGTETERDSPPRRSDYEAIANVKAELRRRLEVVTVPSCPLTEQWCGALFIAARSKQGDLRDLIDSQHWQASYEAANRRWRATHLEETYYVYEISGVVEGP